MASKSLEKQVQPARGAGNADANIARRAFNIPEVRGALRRHIAAEGVLPYSRERGQEIIDATLVSAEIQDQPSRRAARDIDALLHSPSLE